MASRRSKIPTIATSHRSENVSGDEMELINECFMEDGLALSATDKFKVKHLCRKLRRTEETIKGAVSEGETLREQTNDKTQEMKHFINLIKQRDEVSRELKSVQSRKLERVQSRELEKLQSRELERELKRVQSRKLEENLVVVSCLSIYIFLTFLKYISPIVSETIEPYSC